LQQDRSGVQFLNDLHRRDAGLIFTVDDGPVHRRRPAVLWQQREVNIDAPLLWRGKKFRRQDLSVGHHHGDIGVVGRE